ncbi:RNA polymerase sigma-70 factor, ECF subfamily [Pedobacter westerhofensis]|uniref:RNA polymerase sigma-70 factor, ECF subfamily n=1 Tax=Pedobacter westerhofensis TaxID=425512 RepID=A0A521BUS7_9SPHI|nr:RNA polymerase sigma-70 factor [Pedobacter westerhofensis]SMO50908.1 RNA polymerase sigma-70 factor, ECF subfamily [Pedobacter westerhofensis]
MSVNRDNSEKALLQQIITGDEGGFVGIYEIYNRTIYNFIIRYVNSVPMAEDLTQEVFMKIWENRANLAEVKSFKAYLFTTARNHTLNNLKVAFRSEAAIGEVIAGFVKLRNATEDQILYKDYALFLRKTLDELPPRTREIFKLCREEEKTYDEVAKSLNISRNAVKNHMVRSMKVLGSSIKKEFGISLIFIIAILSMIRS